MDQDYADALVLVIFNTTPVYLFRRFATRAEAWCLPANLNQRLVENGD